MPSSSTQIHLATTHPRGNSFALASLPKVASYWKEPMVYHLPASKCADCFTPVHKDIFPNADQPARLFVGGQAEVINAAEQEESSSVARFNQRSLAGKSKVGHIFCCAGSAVRSPNMIRSWFCGIENRYAVKIGSDGLVDFPGAIESCLRGDAHPIFSYHQPTDG